MTEPKRRAKHLTQPIRRPTRPAHHNIGIVLDMTFEQAYAALDPSEILSTAAGTRFTAETRAFTRGAPNNRKVIIFRTRGRERARAYECCWGFQTNCNRTYIDTYTTALVRHLVSRGR